jgi:hypothetical protein
MPVIPALIICGAYGVRSLCSALRAARIFGQSQVERPLLMGLLALALVPIVRGLGVQTKQQFGFGVAAKQTWMNLSARNSAVLIVAEGRGEGAEPQLPNLLCLTRNLRVYLLSGAPAFLDVGDTIIRITCLDLNGLVI